MITKNDKAASIIVISLIALAVIVAVGRYFSRPQTVAAIGDRRIPAVQLSATQPVEQVEVPPTDNPDILSAT